LFEKPTYIECQKHFELVEHELGHKLRKTPPSYHIVALDDHLIARSDPPAGLALDGHFPLVQLRIRVLNLLLQLIKQSACLVRLCVLFAAPNGDGEDLVALLDSFGQKGIPTSPYIAQRREDFACVEASEFFLVAGLELGRDDANIHPAVAATL